jgi:hypothetical protein
MVATLSADRTGVNEALTFFATAPQFAVRVLRFGAIARPKHAGRVG